MTRSGRIGAMVVVALVALPAPRVPARELEAADWRKLRKEAGRLMRAPGERLYKLELIAHAGSEDAPRAAELLIKWGLRSLKLQHGPLERELTKARKDFEKIDAFMRRFYEKMPPKRTEDKRAWKRLKTIFEGAKEAYEIEDTVRAAIGEALSAMRTTEAATYLRDDGLTTLQRAKRTTALQVAVLQGLLRHPREFVGSLGLELAADTRRPRLRILGINWIGRNAAQDGFADVTEALRDDEVPVRRAAVMALRALDDRRAVEPLVAAMQQADGQLAAEIDDVLHWFTGRSFEASASVWKRWWKEEGAAWLAQEPTERHERQREVLPGGTRVRFYGIPTESHNVVFVLDRSGSMKEKAGERSARRKKRDRRPVTGTPPPGEADGDPPVPGDTKMEVAKNQLARSVDQLDPKVRFNIVFYSNDVRVWKPAPELVPSSKAHKEDAKQWFLGLEPSGSTCMFAALLQALEYADTIGERTGTTGAGADTIFLISDGSPTSEAGELLTPAELERQYRSFMDRNALYHCVVHTIGIGPAHNSSVLERLARETGGQYKAVGAD